MLVMTNKLRPQRTHFWKTEILTQRKDSLGRTQMKDCGELRGKENELRTREAVWRLSPWRCLLPSLPPPKCDAVVHGRKRKLTPVNCSHTHMIHTHAGLPLLTSIIWSWPTLWILCHHCFALGSWGCREGCHYDLPTVPFCLDNESPLLSTHTTE